MKGILKFFAVFLLMCMALGLTTYPFIANFVFENRADSLVETIERSVGEEDEKEKEAAIRQAREYNEALACGHIQLRDPFVDQNLNAAGDYASLLCMNEDGVMGFIEIPSINLSLPIYHGTSAEVLELGAGHLEGTSLPIGGESTHSVLTGHTGLSSAKLFTDLAELEKGDMFFLNVMGEKLAYVVDQTKVVLPTELSDLSIMNGKDYCTLITCTPYGVNTHRLLVRGERTDYPEAVENPDSYRARKTESKWMSEYQSALKISIAFFLTGVLVLLLSRYFRKNHLRNGEEE